MVADFYRQEEGDFLFSIYSKFISPEGRLSIQAENSSAVPEFAPFDAFLEFGERRPSK